MFEKIKKIPTKILILTLMGTIVAITGLNLTFRTLNSKKQTIYVKLKISQGLWWSNTKLPPHWFIESIQIGDTEKNLLNKTIAEITNINYYPYHHEQAPDQYQIFLTAKILVDPSRQNKYNFKRNPVSVGSAIDLELNSTQVSGNIVALSKEPIENNLIEKTIWLTKLNSFLWEYDAIKIGDSLTNGEETVFKVIDKSKALNSVIIPDPLGNLRDYTNTPTNFITVKAKIKLQKYQDKYYFGEEQQAIPGKSINLLTPSFNYSPFVISKIK